jgi:hypothetical protein
MSAVRWLKIVTLTTLGAGAIVFGVVLWLSIPTDVYQVNCYNTSGALVWSNYVLGRPDFDDGLWTWDDVDGIEIGTSMQCGYFNASERNRVYGLVPEDGGVKVP